MKKILIPILATVLVSLCAGIGPTPTPTVTGLGLEIITFESETLEIYSNGSTSLRMEIENKGEFSVPSASSLIYLMGSSLNLGDTSGFYWYSATGETSPFKHFNKEMKSEDPLRGTPPTLSIIRWSLKAPTVSRGQTRPDTFKARVYYDYETTVNGNVWVYSEAEADAAYAAGKELSKSNFDPTEGPIAVTVTVSPDPVVLYGTDNYFNLFIELSNKGGGTLYKKGAVTYTTPEDINITRVELNKVNVTIDKGTADLTITGCKNEQELIAGRDTTLICDVTIGSPPTTVESYPLAIHVEYGYITEKTIDVTVSGR